ncbi:hypothetical protein Kpol_1054p26 [Vanderwaltozyma polyspora DSM 70294]|uniref:Fmp45p n=1 Tax=Vanderwaltozyma polyspora (strain ATCC 22028 / DSM 70294 / BCRC 21397 / CBS 2163 / NBRC 10782 / NRRL Y-8283 / UCD 57-17) TaxID=436907 RepID=A7TIB3_VANPO|nr:uncharacterized protein Kpol_1054p26 [Vanderwaltozyma polyspora DSM 70294]EDO17979.1 hypothetical protein Kpol_1054p26 [Vanderwaltozyma polyspora DSM 70294]
MGKKMIFKKFVHLLTFFFLLGAGLLTFIVVLSGARSTGTLTRFYWLEADTSGFNSAPNTTRWYNYEFCGWDGHRTSNCSSKGAAKPFSPKDNFGPSDNMPRTFLDNRNAYYYLSRIGWSFLLVSLFFIVTAIIPQIINIFKVIPGIAIWSTVSCWFAMFFMTLTSCLYTGCYVKARQAFNRRDRRAKLGAKNFAFIWTSTFLLMVNSVWETATVVLSKKSKYDRYPETPTFNSVSGDVSHLETSGGYVNNPEVAKSLPTQKKKLFNKLRTNNGRPPENAPKAEEIPQNVQNDR